MYSKIYNERQPIVLNGPFKGMRYICSANGSQLLPKLIGSYEEPIHRWIDAILESGRYAAIVDVGCAEGYYAVGLTRAKSNPQVYAFDIDDKALANAKKLAEVNDVSGSISFADTFDRSALKKVISRVNNRNILIFMDVEGAELGLLNVDRFPEIKNCDILVELHDCFMPGLTEKVVDFLSETHKIEIVFDYPWREKNYETEQVTLTESLRDFCMNERRPPKMRWMLAKKK